MNPGVISSANALSLGAPSAARSILSTQTADAPTDGPTSAPERYLGYLAEGPGCFAGLVALLADPSHTPAVFFCNAGKDRTGVAAALVLLALGVPRETVMRDYLLTNEVFKPPWTPRADIDPEVLQALWGVQESYLETAFEAIDSHHGGAEHYLRHHIGLDDAQFEALSRRYLQPE